MPLSLSGRLKEFYGRSVKPFLTIHYVLAFLAIVAVAWFLFGRSSAAAPITIEVQKRDFTQQVSVAGTVIARDAADLGFAQSGRISALYARSGDTVRAGQLIAEIENGDLRAMVAQRQAALDRERAKLAALRAGARVEDVAVSEAGVAAAVASVEQAKLALINAINDAYRAGDDAIHTKTDQYLSNPRTSFPQLNFLTSDSQLKNSIESKRPAIEKTLEAWNEDAQSSSLDSSLDAHVSVARASITAIRDYLKDASDALARGISGQNVSTAQLQAWATDTNLARTNVNATLSTLTSAATALRSAETALIREQKGLGLKQAPATPEDIASQEASVKAAQADVASAAAQLRKTQILAPFTGVVTKVDIERGEIATGNTSSISIMSSGRYQIETYVSELNIAEVSVGQTATATLDAYGKSQEFGAKVTAIDPGRTIKDGVTTYKTMLEFLVADDRIRSGMTADTVITTDVKHDTFVVPNSAIIQKGADRYVKVIRGKETTERKVEVGGKSLVETEILGGLTEGDMILINPK